MNKIDNYLQAALESNASDLHFISGRSVAQRVCTANLQRLMDEVLTIDAVPGMHVWKSWTAQTQT